jgi:4-hydroxyacetophenone monooxygenase
MSISRPVQPITAHDAALESAIADAQLPALVAALAFLTGDASLLRDTLRPDSTFAAGEQGGMTPERQAEGRALALHVLARYRDQGCPPAPPPDAALVLQIVDWMTGGKATADYVPLLLEELAITSADPRAPAWSKREIAPQRSFLVAIIGSGMSGLLAGIRLKQAGVPFVIIEKNADVGGTWHENVYPGARVDNPNHSYSYSFAQKSDWPFHFSPQQVLYDYFRAVADEYGMREHIRFRTEVSSAAYDDSTGLWSLRLRTPEGTEEALIANAVISAVGQLNRPKLPDIRGMGSFEGPTWHSARWDHSVDLRGKAVAVIGTGASASQFIPKVADEAAKLTIFQRTPNWYVTNPNYTAEVAPGLRWLFAHVPHYAQWYRFWLFWTSTDGLLPMAQVDPTWPDMSSTVGAGNMMLREMMAMALRAQLDDRPDLIDKVIPSYPPASKRIVVDNGIWPATIKRDNVELVTQPIQAINPRGVVTDDGVEHHADVIIYGTGFHASKFLMPMKVTGTAGVDLQAQWDGDARAYLGITVPNFPNLFLMYGPNTNIVVNGSIIYFSECEMRYILECVRLLLSEGHRAMDCRQDVHDAYNVRIDAGNRQMAWGVATVNSWYRNDKGRVAQNWPFTMLEYWQQTRTPDPADYVFS